MSPDGSFLASAEANPYIRHFQLLTFPTNRGICFSLKAIPNGMKMLHSCTVRGTVARLPFRTARLATRKTVHQETVSR